jgi:predicted MFS family arabinose efflux permease
MAVLFTLSFNFSVLLPLLAKRTFHGGAGTFGSLLSMMGIGSFLGALVMAHRSKPSRRVMTLSALAFGVASLGAALAPNLGLEMAAMFFVGISSISFMVNGNSTLQLRSAPEMRGRVMALYGMVFLGTTPIGALLAGWVAERFGPRVGLGAGGAIAAAAAGIALWSLARGASGSVGHGSAPAEAIAA